MLAEVTPHDEDKYGVRYTADIPVQGTEGREAVVRTGWILPHRSREAHLTTLYVVRVKPDMKEPLQTPFVVQIELPV